MGPARKKQRLSDGSVADMVESPVATVKEPVKAEKAVKTGDQQSENNRRSLFVRSLPSTTTTEKLTELFSESYPVKHAVAVIDATTQLCRGYGFVTFADAEDAQRAQAEFNGHVLDGKKLRIEVAERRQRNGEEGAVSEAKTKREQDKAKSVQPTKLIVRNLPWTIKGDKDLSNMFLSYGKVKQAYIPKRSGGLLPGFGFVVMRGRKNAEKALEGVNGKEIDGRTIAVDWAVEKEVFKQTAPGADESNDGVDADAHGGEDVDEDGSGDDMEGVAVDNEDDEDEDDEGDNEDMEESEIEEDEPEHREDDRSSTLFVRNLPFTCSDEDLEDHFSQFGSTRYARVVLDRETGRPKGTGFVCFYERDDAEICLREAPTRSFVPGSATPSGDNKALSTGPSVLQNVDADSTGRYTLDGRVLQVSRAVDYSEANRLTQEGVANRSRRDRDKRRLYLLSEGTISSQSKLWDSLSPSERTMREASAKQRKTLIEGNPSLHMSLTRLSIRNLPRSIDSKELKQLARQAVVGFATDVKEGRRQRLTKEEVERGGDEMKEAEEARRNAGKGVVKQAKVVFEGEGGSKVSEASGAGRSRGYGFIEYHTHRNALMGLRWLNGHAVGYQVNEPKGKHNQEAFQDRKKRLIVEFAIENAQVVHRRQDREQKARERSRAVQEGRAAPLNGVRQSKNDKLASRKRKRDPSSTGGAGRKPGNKGSAGSKAQDEGGSAVDEKLARRNRIIGKKRAMRRDRQGGKK